MILEVWPLEGLTNHAKDLLQAMVNDQVIERSENNRWVEVMPMEVLKALSVNQVNLPNRIRVRPKVDPFSTE